MIIFARAQFTSIILSSERATNHLYFVRFNNSSAGIYNPTELGAKFNLAKSLVKISLLHELGKLGDPENELYIPQDSDWHREKLGQNYPQKA